MLVPMTRDDIPDLARIAVDDSIFRYIPDIPLPFDAGRWVRSVIANDAHSLKHVIRRRAGGEPVGFLQLGQRRNGTLQIGYFLARDQWGQGFAREACRVALAFLRAEGDWRPVYAAVHRENHASIRTLEALGFSRIQFAQAHVPDPDMIDFVWPGAHAPGAGPEQA